jgi:Fe-S-cluster-containing hydrogenase component 2
MAQKRSISAEDLSRLEPFSSLAPLTVKQILEASRLVELRPKQRLSTQARDPKGESYCFVLAGQVAIVLGSGEPAGAAADAESENSTFIGFFGPGDLFSDGYRDVEPSPAGEIDCVASTAVRLLMVPATTLYQLASEHRDWAARISHTVALSRRRFLGQQEPTRRVVQDFFLRRGYGSSRRIRVAEMSHCLDCDKCERACRKRHGQVRMNRAYARLGRLAIQRFCVNCTEQSCLATCAFGGLVLNQAGEIQVTPDCNGCGACARMCPFGAIEILEKPYTVADFPAALPVVDDVGRTTVPGLLAVGEVCGPRPTKVATEEAKRAIDALSVPGQASAGVMEVIVVGGGAAGLAAAERCQERHLPCMVLEKEPQLSAKARRLASVVPVQAGMEVRSIRPAREGQVEVEIAQGRYLARNVVVATGKPVTGQPSLLAQAGVPMIEPGTSQMRAYATRRGSHPVAIKCDNCAGFPDRACLRACPTATMVELPAQELFFEQGAADQPAKFSAVAFIDGVAEHRARARRRGAGHAILAWVLILGLIGTGLEILLRRYWPAYSFAAQVGPMLGDGGPVWYKPSRGYGHWLGYVGTTFMLLTLFYPLRTRLGMLKNWGLQSTWMSVHLWVGFIGATLVTYHSALQLGRWVGLACFAMWLVVLSGVVGRYLYGMLRSGLGLLDFDRISLRSRVIGGGVLQILGPRYARLLTAEPEKPGLILTEMFVMLGHELRDFLTGLRLRLGGLSHLPTREARRQALRLFSELAAYRRSCRYLESARRLVRYWNWVHIILTITMFVLAGFHITYGFMYKAV